MPRPRRRVRADAPAQSTRAVGTDADEDFELNIERRRVSEKEFRAETAVETDGARGLHVGVGVALRASDIEVLLLGVRGHVRFRATLALCAGSYAQTTTTTTSQGDDNTVGTVGGVANTALQPGGVVDRTVGTVGQTLNNVTQPGGPLNTTVNNLGQTVQRVVDRSGNIVELTLDAAGRVINSRVVSQATGRP